MYNVTEISVLKKYLICYKDRFVYNICDIKIVEKKGSVAYIIMKKHTNQL